MKYKNIVRSWNTMAVEYLNSSVSLTFLTLYLIISVLCLCIVTFTVIFWPQKCCAITIVVYSFSCIAAISLFYAFISLASFLSVRCRLINGFSEFSTWLADRSVVLTVSDFPEWYRQKNGKGPQGLEDKELELIINKHEWLKKLFPYFCKGCNHYIETT
jgi:hypothetical protein